MTRNNLQSARNLATEERRRKAVAMKLAGKRVKEIAKELQVSESAAHRYIRENHTVSIQARVGDGQKEIEEKLAELAWVRAEARKGWERSQSDKEKITTKSPGKIGDEITQTIEGQVGDPRFLQIYRECIKQECEMLGINAPIKIEAKTETNTNVNVQVGITVQALESMSNDELLEYLDETRSTLVSGPSSEAGTDSPSVVPQLPPQETTDVPPRE